MSQPDLSSPGDPNTPCRVDYVLDGRTLTLVESTNVGGELVATVFAGGTTQGRNGIRAMKDSSTTVRFRVKRPVVSISVVVYVRPDDPRGCSVARAGT